MELSFVFWNLQNILTEFLCWSSSQIFGDRLF